jgi:predicted permease
VSGLFGRERREREFAAEIDSHLAMHIEDKVRAGMMPEEARHEAMLELGGVEKTKQAYRERSTLPLVENALSDLKFGIRQLVKNPGFAATAIVVLALGIGTSVAIFGFVDAALLEPLPYADPGKLMSVNESSAESRRWPLSYPDYVDWKRLNHSFRSLDVYNPSGYLLRTASGAEQVQAERVSSGFFQTLGVRPMLGRDFYADEDRQGGPDVLLLSYGAWLHRFGARREAVGETVDLDGRSFTIIGVLPREFSFAPGGNAEFWVPLSRFSTHEKMRIFYNFWGIGRLREGVTAEAARAELTAIAEQLQRQYGMTSRRLSASIVPLSEILIGDVRPILLTLLAGAGLLFLIACVNVASLVLVRSESRRREVAVRGALGATRLRVACQFVTEGLLLALLGSLAGIVVAAGMMKVLVRLVPKDMASNLPFLDGVGVNAHTAAFAAAVALLSTLLLAATPISRLLPAKIHDGLTDGDRGAAGRLWRRLGANLVVVELAIAVVLLAGAGLLGKSLYRLLHVPLGFDPDHVATVRVSAPGTVYKDDEQTIGLYREIVRRVSSLPGVESAGITSMLPVRCNCAIDRIQFVGRPYHGEHNDVDERHVSAAYLATLKTGLVRGRFFRDGDDISKPGVAVINQTLARRYFPGEDPIGQRITDNEGGREATWEIVGVVNDVREGPLDVETWPAEYFPITQTLDSSFSLAVRTGQDAGALLPELVDALHGIDPNLGVSDEATMNEKIEATQSALLHRFSAWLVGGFAAVALVLSVVGLYGVIAYSVSQRTREIGVRMALGAQRASVYRMILREAGWLVGIGVVVGLGCSMGAGILMRTLLFGVRAWDLPTLAGVAMVLGVFALVASFVPARRAALVNPVDALRAE